MKLSEKLYLMKVWIVQMSLYVMFLESFYIWAYFNQGNFHIPVIPTILISNIILAFFIVIKYFERWHPLFKRVELSRKYEDLNKKYPFMQKRFIRKG